MNDKFDFSVLKKLPNPILYNTFYKRFEACWHDLLIQWSLMLDVDPQEYKDILSKKVGIIYTYYYWWARRLYFWI